MDDRAFLHYLVGFLFIFGIFLVNDLSKIIGLSLVSFFNILFAALNEFKREED
ncbi:MAG: hypothetical protein ACOC5T_07390 [Elusimicrobiota bacterium]